MAENEWAVIYFGGAFAFVKLDNKNRKKFYWSGGYSYAYFQDDTRIEKSYGIIDDRNDRKIDEAELDFLKTYNTPAEYISQMPGWLSPSGNFYPCEYWKHDSTARCLAAIYHNSLEGTKVLEENSWIRVLDGGYPSTKYLETFVPTQAQINTLHDILQSFCRDEEYKKTMQKTLDFWLSRIDKENQNEQLYGNSTGR